MRGSVQHKNGNYYVVLAFGPTRRDWLPGGRTRREAEHRLAEEMAKVNKGAYRKRKKINFKDFALLWLEQYAKGKVKESTYIDYELSIRLYLIPAFGHLQLTEISLEHIQCFVNAKVAEGKIAAKTICNILVPLKVMFKHAIRWDYLSVNPAQYVEKPRVHRKEMDFLTPEEVKRFLEAADTRNHAVFMMACFAGLRRGELFACRWSNLDWGREQYFVRENLFRNKFIEPKSSHSKQSVNLSPALIRALEKHRAEQNKDKLLLSDQYHDLGLIFCQGNGKPLEPRSLIRHHFEPALKKAEIRRVPFHSLRHTFVTLLIAQGENLKYISRQARHASIQTTIDRYGHLLPEANREAGTKLDKAVFGISFAQPLAEGRFT